MTLKNGTRKMIRLAKSTVTKRLKANGFYQKEYQTTAIRGWANETSGFITTQHGDVVHVTYSQSSTAGLKYSPDLIDRENEAMAKALSEEAFTIVFKNSGFIVSRGL